MNPRLAQIGVVVCLLALHAVASAAAVDYLLQLQGIPGESQPPGFPDATQIHSLTVTNGAFAATQLVDSTSPKLAAAETSATLIHNAAIALYDDPNTATRPDAQLAFHDLLISGIQSVMVGPQLGEAVTYQFASPSLSLFLALPGISGESSPPGQPNVIQIDSLTISGNSFSVHKAIDSTSPALTSALVSAHDFTTASLLFYSSIATQTKPDFSIVFQHALISSIANDSGSDRLAQTVAFEAAGSAVPEPESLIALAALGALALTRIRRRAFAL